MYFVFILAQISWLGTGLPNPNFRNQEFFVKKQELIRRSFSKTQERNQETFSRNQKENRTVSRTFFGKARIPLSQMFIVSVFNKRVMKRSVLLTETKKNRKIIIYSLFYCSFSQLFIQKCK
jgi:hypothetical protein